MNNQPLIRAILILSFAAMPMLAHAEVENEKKIKAAIVYKILRFVTWPNDTNSNDTLYLCVAHIDPYYRAFLQINGRKVGRKTIKIIAPESQGAIRTCATEFTSLEQREMALINETNTGEAAVLTISDRVNFAERGGIINLVVKNNRVAFRINVQAARNANIKISSSLLKLAEIVETEPREETRPREETEPREASETRVKASQPSSALPLEDDS